MKTGLYFGSFNPIHVGHLIIANHILNLGLVEQIWFIVSPQNPLKKQSELLNEYNRLFLVQKAIEDNARFRASDIEFKLPRPSYTIDTLTYLHEKYSTNEFAVIVGSDSYTNINKWKNSETLLRNYSFLIYLRPGFDVKKVTGNAVVLKAPLLEISSTEIRNNLKLGKSIRYLVTEKVLGEIEENNYYKK